MAVVGAKLVNVATWTTLALTHAGDSVVRAFGLAQAPDFVTNLQANKMGSTMGAWFLGNTLSQNMLNTGAFEVYYDGETIFSKIRSGRLPSMPEIMTGLEEAIDRRRELESAPAAAELPVP